MAPSQRSAQPCRNAPSCGLWKHPAPAAEPLQHVTGAVDVGIAETGRDGWKEKRNDRTEEGLHPVAEGLKDVKELLGK